MFTSPFPKLWHIGTFRKMVGDMLQVECFPASSGGRSDHCDSTEWNFQALTSIMEHIHGPRAFLVC